MTEDFDEATLGRDGIPEDVETGWVAVTPVPVGKRCLAVTQQASGIPGIVPNTTLRSRVLGKPLMKPFPTPLPPQTVLDCILDENWRETGILHVLDVLRWKGQDVGECETLLRFWWRDTRLSELPPFPPPPTASEPQDNVMQSPLQYQFPYPATFVPIPYHTDTTLAHLASTLIPITRTSRFIPVSKPIFTASGNNTGDMDLDGAISPLVRLGTFPVEVKSDGMLLYVSQATYEPGTSPLSSWLPLRVYSEETKHTCDAMVSAEVKESHLETFERLVKQRIALGLTGRSDLLEVKMDMA